MIDDAFDTDGSIANFGFNVEYENEKGLGLSDPYMQHIGYYVRYWSKRDGPKRHCCPWILMEVLGQEIGLSGAVWAAGRPTCLPLSLNVPFLPVPADRDLFLMQARLCMALRLGVTHLVEWYSKLGDSIPPSPQANFPFPRRARFEGIDQEVVLQYTGMFGNGEVHRKMLFVAKRTDTEQSVLIKFTQSPYGTEVHHAVAAKDLAPALHDVRQEAGLLMVVMELICGSYPLTSRESSREKVTQDLLLVQKILEENNFVHGDLRPPNLHVTVDGRLVVFDFDWAGSEGEVRYPDVLNPTERWPPGAAVGCHITKEHDKFMIDTMLSTVLSA
jgi:hypothetical protein